MWEFINTIFEYNFIKHGISIIIIWGWLIYIVFWPNYFIKKELRNNVDI